MDLLEKLENSYRKLRGLFSRLKRLRIWIKFIWTNWDFDGASIYDLINFKLQRIEHEVVLHGNSIIEEKHISALRIMLKLSSRLSTDWHESKYRDWHEQRWGNLSFSFEDLPNGMSRLHSHRTKATTDTEKDQERMELMESYTKSRKWQERDEKLLFTLLQKHIRYLWD